MAKKTSKPTDPTKPTQFNDFLKPEHFSGKGPFKLSLTGWARRIRSKFGEQISVEVINDRDQVYDFAFKDGSPNHRAMFKAFGNQHEAAWKSGVITVEVNKGKFGSFLSIIDVETDQVPY